MRGTLKTIATALAVMLVSVASAIDLRFENSVSGANVTNSASFTVNDPEWNVNQFTPNSSSSNVKNYVELSVIEDMSYYYSSFDITVPLTVKFYTLNSSGNALVQNTEEFDLNVTYSASEATTHIDRHYYDYDGAYKIEVSVGNTGTSNIGGTVNGVLIPTAAIPQVLKIGASINLDRHYEIPSTPLNDPNYVFNIVKGYNATSNELTLTIDPEDWSEYYELEYTWVNSADGNGGTLALGSISHDFENNSTRIYLDVERDANADPIDIDYAIPMVFQKGYLVWRARAVGVLYTDPTKKLYSGWSHGNLSDNLMSSYPPSSRQPITAGHESKLNWQRSSAFAENGKRKDVVSYADGTLRSRQSVTRINSDDNALAGETYYDHQGRGAVTAMPAPTGSQALKYYSSFNRPIGTTTRGYNRDDFDITSSCGLTVVGMDHEYGSSNYYSPENPDQAEYQGLLPDSEDFPFVQVEYTPDLTGRIRRQSGVGSDFKLGSGKEVKYFYGTPAQEELDLVFGSEVGYAQRYQKNMVQDPNGQLAISYIDPYGRTVATCMAGDAPGAVSILSSNTGGASRTIDILETNSAIPYNVVDLEEGTISVSRTVLIDDEGEYTFNYSMTAADFDMLNDCPPAGLCYECVYDLTISIIDDCGAEMIPSGPHTQRIGSLDQVCGSTVTHSSPAWAIELLVGNYHITKTLTVAQDALDYYTDLYLNNDECLLDLQYFIDQELAQTDFSSCYPIENCDAECLATFGARDDWTGDLDEYDSLYAACQNVCYFPNQCESYLSMMRIDVSPGGQYGATTTTPSDDWAVSVYNTSNSIPGSNDNWKYPDGGTYLDANGNDALVGVTDLGGSYSPATAATPTADAYGALTVELQDLTNLSDFLAQPWLPSYADALVKYHPEYCYVEFCESNRQAEEYTYLLLNTETWDDAVAAGYVTENTTYATFRDALVKADPYFTENAVDYDGGDYDGWGSAATGKYNQRSAFLGDLDDVDGSGKDFREIAIGIAYCEGLTGSTTPTFATCVSNNLSFWNDGCSRDKVWNALKMLYISARIPYIEEAQMLYAIENGCYNGCIGENITDFTTIMGDDEFGCPSATQTCGSGYDNNYNWGAYEIDQICGVNRRAYFEDKVKRVPDITDIQDWTGVTDLYSTNTTTLQSNINTEITDQCESACEQMADSWMTQLVGCADLSGVTAQDMIDLEAYLVWVCKQGCDENNPYGSSTAPGASPYESFEDAIYAIIYDSTGTMDVSCTDELITFPGPSGNNMLAGNSFGGLDTCYCDLVLQAESDYTDSLASQTFTDNGFPAFAEDYLGVQVVDVDKTVCDCNEAFEYGSGGPSWDIDSDWHTNAVDSLAGYAAFIPEGLRCPVCINCDAIDDGITSLETKFSITFSWDTHGELLADYLNDEHNMMLPFFEYLDFAQACDSLALPGDSSACLGLEEVAADLLNLLNTYATFPHDTACLCSDPFADVWTNQLAAMLDASYDGSSCSHTMYYDATESDSLNYVLEFSGLDNACDLILTLPDEYDWDDILDIVDFSGLTWVSQNGTSGDFTVGMTVIMNTGKKEEKVYIVVSGSIDCLDVADCVGAVADLLLCDADISTLVLDLDTNPCVTYLTDLAISNGTMHYEAYINEQIEAFQLEYISDCLAAADDETFTMSGNVNRYHYTLFYFDQAGNLDKTVPPAGVDFLTTQTEFDDAKDYRNDPVTYPTSEVLPAHTLLTYYKYNALNQLVETRTPDGGTTTLYYDRMGRVVASQNAKQAAYSPAGYNYVLYDNLGRPVESGELRTGTALAPVDAEDAFLFNFWMNTGTKQQITYTYYDESPTIGGVLIDTHFGSDGQQNLRNRVASTMFKQLTSSTDYIASHYSYDIHGNVQALIQENTTLNDLDHDIKRMDYEYDLISGNVNKVYYQKGAPDQFVHRYTYDADNRITAAETSYDDIIYDQDAGYKYYQHGPLARTVIGDQEVQGIDFAYTIQGWLKGANASSVHHDRDMGADGVQGGNKYGADDIHEAVGRDAFAFTLHYYSGDYTQIHALEVGEVAFEDDIIADKSLTGLYNGNIRSMITAMQNTSQTAQAVHGNVYTYDQLQRIKSSDVLRATNGSSVVGWGSAIDDNQYDTEYTYDANGNLTNLKRKGNDTGALQMDDFTYHYNSGTNQLDYVSDAGGNDGTYTTDIDNTQSAGNYDYDAIGQLVADDNEDIYEIKWNTNGKISNVIRTSDVSVQSSDLDFYYGPDGQRVMKVVKPRVNGVLQNEDKWTTTYYVRDAAGNVMTTYELSYTSQGGNDYTAHIEPTEQYLYGSKRLGTRQAWSSLHQLDTDAPFTASGFTGAKRFIYTSSPSPNTPTHGDTIKRQLGQKTYELSNHLGNVLVTTSDRKLPVETSGAVDYFTADVLSYSDYYPFGMQMPGRHGNTGEYRYGFNGMEKDDEIKASGNSYDFGARMYDARVGRWLSLDPAMSEYAGWSPYVFVLNTPIRAFDPDGKRPWFKSKEEMMTVVADLNLVYRETYGIDFDAFHTVVVEIDGETRYTMATNSDFGWNIDRFASSVYDLVNTQEPWEIILESDKSAWHGSTEGPSWLFGGNYKIKSGSKDDPYDPESGGYNGKENSVGGTILHEMSYHLSQLGVDLYYEEKNELGPQGKVSYEGASYTISQHYNVKESDDEHSPQPVIDGIGIGDNRLPISNEEQKKLDSNRAKTGQNGGTSHKSNTHVLRNASTAAATGG